MNLLISLTNSTDFRTRPSWATSISLPDIQKILERLLQEIQDPDRLLLINTLGFLGFPDTERSTLQMLISLWRTIFSMHLLRNQTLMVSHQTLTTMRARFREDSLNRDSYFSSWIRQKLDFKCLTNGDLLDMNNC